MARLAEGEVLRSNILCLFFNGLPYRVLPARAYTMLPPDPDLEQFGNTTIMVRRDPAIGDTTQHVVHRWCRQGQPTRSTSTTLADA